MLSNPINLSHSINGRFSFIEKQICELQRTISLLNTNKPVDPLTDLLPIIKELQSDISTINTKDITQDSYISAIRSDISTINNALSNLPITMFNNIYPIGCIYSSITATPPPNMIIGTTAIEDSAFSPANIDDTYWDGRLAKWELLESGRFLRNLGPIDINHLETTTGGTDTVAKHTHTVGGNTEHIYGALVNSVNNISYGTFNSSTQTNSVLNATASTVQISQNIYPERIVITANKNDAYPNRYTDISLDPTKITLNEMETDVTEQIPPFQYVYIYKRIAKET